MAIVAQLIAAWDGSSRAQLTPAWVEDAPGLSITIDGDFERSCVNPSLSSWDADFGDGQPIVRIQARRQTLRRGDGSYDTNQWLEPVARITGVQGVRPWITFQPFNSTGGVDGYSNQTWITSQRAHYSYDGITWAPFNAPAISASELRFRPPAAFEQDVVYVARSWPRSVTQVGNQIAAISAAHPDKVFPTPSATAFTPSITNSFPAQNFILGEVGAKLNELGGSIPATPLYGFVVDDSAYAGNKKLAVMTAGVHASEDVGELWLWEMVDFVLNGTSAEAIYARQNFKIHVYPLVNTSGRAGGYWRGSPDHVDDPNTEWYEATPSHEFVGKIKSAILADVGGAAVAWAIDTHASRSGTRAQLGVRTALPSTVEYDTRVRARYPAGDWSDYESRSTPLDMTSGTIRTFFTRELQPGLSMLHEVCDRPGSVTPAVMRPYAEASIGALVDMDAAGWFDEAPTGTLTLGTPSVTASSISLPWTYSAADHDGIEYRYRLTAGTWSAWIDAGLVSPIEITGLTSGAEYEIEARAYNAAGAGSPQTVTVTVGAAIDLAGAALATATSAGTLTTAIPLSGAAAALSAAAGNLSAQITLSGAALAEAAATAALTAGAADLAGDATALATALGTLTVQIRLAGDAVAQSLAAADLTTESAGLSGAAQASATAMGLIGTAIPLAGEATATASASGTLGVPVLLSGAAAAVSNATGELTIALALEGHALATALASGSLSTAIPLSGAAVAQALASGALAGAALLTPASRTWRVRYPVRLLRVRT